MTLQIEIKLQDYSPPHVQQKNMTLQIDIKLQDYHQPHA